MVKFLQIVTTAFAWEEEWI